MSSARYQPVAIEDHESKYDPSDASPEALHAKLRQDPRFNQPAPALWKRILLLVFFFGLVWLGFNLRLQGNSDPKVVHAQRYSKDYKFRPAASPVISERLKDGRVRVRGAQPTYAAHPVKPVKGKGKEQRKAKKRGL
ncbi:hypothetical protein NEOLEDRAFT_1074740 [Neolentinus lepideus HHB14362 ss-1]|uniref:Transmembrane protein n=1 Tax=Neolentinus lepideus HHB14362 ss-1 TaxID=1314782 RepID=A0A165PDY0_9AGAM|nr:hypothetical protein NEOLEDRAFT_1074740 [Neolentinus lepideus HHB14362 ss-1]